EEGITIAAVRRPRSPSVAGLARSPGDRGRRTAAIVIPSSSAWYPFLDTLADSVNPLLALVAILIAAREWRRSSRQAAVAFAVATALSLGGVYAVRFLDDRF